MTQENKVVSHGIFKWTDDEKELLIDEYGKFLQTSRQHEKFI